MPTPSPSHSIWQVRIEATLFDQHVMNVFHYRRQVDTEAENFLDVAADLLAKFAAVGSVYDKYLTCVSDDLQVDWLVAQQISPTRLVAIRQAPAVSKGFDPAPTLPVNIAATITRRGVKAQRNNVGSIHVPGIAIASMDEDTNEWTDTHMGHLGELATAIVTELVSGEGFGFYTPILWNGALDVPTDVDLISANPHREPRVMRRRTKGLGI